MPREYMTTAEAARALGLSYRGLRDRIVAGIMRAERFGPRAWMVPVDEVERWRGRGKLKPGPKPRQPKSSAARQQRHVRSRRHAIDERYP